MARAAYDTTADVYTGPSAVPPSAFRFTVACRLVPETEIIGEVGLAGRVTHHVNYNGLPASAGTSFIPTHTVVVDLDKADQFEIPSGSGTFYRVLWGDLVGPAFTPGYRRVAVEAL